VAQVVHKDDIALLQCRHEHLLDIREDGWAVYGAIDHVRRSHAVDAQRANQRLRFQVTVRHLRDQPFAQRSAA